MNITDPLTHSLARMDLCVYVTGDITFSTQAFADVTGLTASLSAGKKYAFIAHLFHISASANTGAWFGVNISGGTPTTLIVANISGVTNSITGGTISLGSATALDTAITGQTTGSAGITVTILSGLIEPVASGTFAIRSRPEVAANMTVKKGSFLIIREVEN